MAEYATNPEHKDFLLRITSATEEGKVGERERKREAVIEREAVMEREREREGGIVSDRERERERWQEHTEKLRERSLDHKLSRLNDYYWCNCEVKLYSL